MRGKTLPLMLVAVFSGPASASEPSPAFSGHDPLFQWASWAPDPLKLRVCFEGAAITGTQEWTLPSLATSDMPAAAVGALRNTDYPARFAVVEHSGRKVILPESVRDAAGNWVAATSLLGTRIDLEPRVRSTDEALGALLAALEDRTGSQVFPSTSLNGSAVTDAGGSNVTARDVLIEILDDHMGDDRAHNGVWRLVWYDGGQHWVLNIDFVSSLNERWGPPPPRPSPAEPPRR